MIYSRLSQAQCLTILVRCSVQPCQGCLWNCLVPLESQRKKKLKQMRWNGVMDGYNLAWRHTETCWVNKSPLERVDFLLLSGASAEWVQMKHRSVLLCFLQRFSPTVFKWDHFLEGGVEYSLTCLKKAMQRSATDCLSQWWCLCVKFMSLVWASCCHRNINGVTMGRCGLTHMHEWGHRTVWQKDV